jgi:predicted DNA-binding ribbon-helix-helix protein
LAVKQHHVSNVDMFVPLMQPQHSASVGKLNTKFMQTLETDVYKQLKAIARERGITVQEFLRAIVVPDWLRSKGKGSERNRRAWAKH